MHNLGIVLVALASSLGVGVCLLAWFIKSSRFPCLYLWILSAFLFKSRCFADARTKLFLAWFVRSRYCEKGRTYLLDELRNRSEKLGHHNFKERRRDFSDVVAQVIYKNLGQHLDVEEARRSISDLDPQWKLLEEERVKYEGMLTAYDVIVDQLRHSLWWPFDYVEKGKAGTKPFFRAVRAWDLLGYLLSPKTRRECYEPTVEDLKADFLKARAKHAAPWSRRFLNVCFAFRTIVILLECMRVGLSGSVAKMVPQAIRVAWRAFFSKPS